MQALFYDKPVTVARTNYLSTEFPEPVMYRSVKPPNEILYVTYFKTKILPMPVHIK